MCGDCSSLGDLVNQSLDDVALVSGDGPAVCRDAYKRFARNVRRRARHGRAPEIFKINFTELPPGGESANLSMNGSINNIYQSDAGVAAGHPFVSVIDAMPGDGMNPLWQEVQVV
jgi:hypothetical protein